MDLTGSLEHWGHHGKFTDSLGLTPDGTDPPYGHQRDPR